MESVGNAADKIIRFLVTHALHEAPVGCAAWEARPGNPACAHKGGTA
jgi:hypothetical protein